MAKNRSIIENYIWSASHQILTILAPLITAPYVARVLGADGTGIASFTTSNNSYFAIMAMLGTTVFGQRNIAYFRNDQEAMSRAFWENFFLRTICSVISLAAYCIFVQQIDSNRAIYWVLCINIVNVAIDISWFYYGIEEFKKTVVCNIAVRIFHIAFIFCFVEEPSDLLLYILSSVGFTALGNLALWFGLPKYVKWVDGINPFRSIKDVFLLFLPTVATQVYVVFDKTMIGVVTESAYQSGCYEQAERIARMALTVVTSISAVVLPRIANLFANHDIEDAKKYVYFGCRFSSMLGLPIMFGLIGITDTFVPVFFGEGYELVNILLPIFSILVVLVSYAHVIGYTYLITTKQQSVYTISVTIAAVCNLVMNLIMIRRFGAIGAAVASILAETIGLVIQISYCSIHKQLQVMEIFKGFWKYLLASVLMMCLVLLVQQYTKESIVSLFVQIAVGMIAYAVGLAVLRDQFFVENVKDFLAKICRKIGKTSA